MASAHLRVLGGAVDRVAPDATAYAHRGRRILAIPATSPENDLYRYTSTFTFAVFLGAYVVAISRYRLYEVDRLISRTVSYGVVTAILAGIYAGGVIGAQAVFGGSADGRPATIVAGSTLLVAALFQPVRRRAQAVVDRRFNRRVHDAARTSEGFGERLREEVELESLVDDLRATAAGIVQPRRSASGSSLSVEDPCGELLLPGASPRSANGALSSGGGDCRRSITSLEGGSSLDQ